LLAEAAGNAALRDVWLAFALLVGVAGFIWLYLVSTPEETADTLRD
jgi:hypothetical protein